jgi:hypothetical protein
MPLKVNDVGKLIIINAGFDLSGNTELRMVLTKHDGTVVTKLKAHGVTAPAVPITVRIDGTDVTFNANEYWQYPTEDGLVDQAGTWKRRGEYVDGTPKDFGGDTTSFIVLPR